MRKTYLWLDIFSIPEFHNGCKLLIVNSLYVYATAVDGFIIAAPDFVFVSTGVVVKDLRVFGHLLDSRNSRRL